MEISNTAFSQNTPAVRVKANEFNHDLSIVTKDWIFSVFEDDEGSFISGGYTHRILGGGTSNIGPSLIKVDKDLEPVWQQNFTFAYVLPGVSRSLEWDSSNYRSFMGSLQDAIQYTDPANNEIYYVSVGRVKLTGRTGPLNNQQPDRLFIVKTDRSGNLVSGFPRVYMNTPNTPPGIPPDTAMNTGWRRGRSIVFDKSPDSGGFFYIAGSDAEPCIFRLNSSLDFNSLTIVSTLPPSGMNVPTGGEMVSICLAYQDGSMPNGDPNTTNQASSHVWATGWGVNLIGIDSCVLITKVAITGSTPFTSDETVYENSPTPPTNKWETGGGNWENHSTSSGWYEHRKDIGKTTCSLSFRNRTGGDVGTGIRQLSSGNIIVTGLANNIFSGYLTRCKPSPPLYWHDADAFARLIDQNRFPNSGLFNSVNPTSGGYEIDCQHIGHYSGMEYIPKVRQNLDGDLYFIGSNGDPNKVKTHTLTGGDLLTNFYVIKTDKDLNPLWDETYRSESANDASCGFGIDICRDGDLVVAGDNKNQDDNYDFIRIADCELNYSNYSTDMISAHSDGVTISVLSQLLGSTGTLNLTTDKQIKGRLVIENGCTVNVSNGAKLQFADMDKMVVDAVSNGFEYGVVIQPGGKLQLENGAILTSLEGCKHKWRGVEIQASGSPDQAVASTIGILEMTNSLITNAICGVSVQGGGLITCTNTDASGDNNTDDLDMVNFDNNRKAVAFYSFSPDNKSRFNFTNFKFTTPTNVIDFGNIGLNAFVTMWDVNKIIFNGCTFKNTYTGPYRVGLGIGALDASFQVLRGNESSSGNPNDGPTGRIPVFENVIIGINNDRTPSNTQAGLIGVGEADFNNCGIGWECDKDNAPLAYNNNFYWDNNMSNFPMQLATTSYGFRSINTDDVKLHENHFTTSGTNSIVTAIGIENSTAFAHKSLLRKNFFTNNSSSNGIKSGVRTSGDNGLFELRCNQFKSISDIDWFNDGPMAHQGTSSTNSDNIFWTTPSTYNIESTTGNPFDYYRSSIQSISSLGVGTVFISDPPDVCTELTRAQVYSSNGTFNGLTGFVFNNLMMLPRPEEEIWNSIKVKNYTEASILTKNLENSDYKKFLKIAIPILETHRESKPTIQEVEALNQIASNNSEAGIDARHFLSFFLEILILPTENIYQSKTKTNSKADALTNNNSIKRSLLKVFPNPTPNIVNFEWDLNTNHPVSLVITDLNGKTIAEYKNLEGKAKQLVDFTNQTSGIYIYKVFTAQSFIKTGKIVVSK